MLLHTADLELTYIVNRDRRFRCFFFCLCCCNQRRVIKLLSSIPDADADTPVVAADQPTAVVTDAADPEPNYELTRSES